MAKVELLGAADVNRSLAALGIKAAADKKKVAMGAARIIKEAAEANAPDRSGNLKENIVEEVLAETDEAIEVGVGPHKKKAFYGLILEYGADDHLITKDQKKALASDEEVYGPRVDHPGVPARPWLRPAFDENVDRAVAEAAAEVKKSLGL